MKYLVKQATLNGKDEIIHKEAIVVDRAQAVQLRMDWEHELAQQLGFVNYVHHCRVVFSITALAVRFEQPTRNVSHTFVNSKVG